MKYLSVCSGIEAASVAWHPLGWSPVAFSEIDPFAIAVLAHHYPGVPNWGDMTTFQDWPHATIDVLVGGTPCQSFSLAGLRKGLDDPRGNLMLAFAAIARRYRSVWLVWENVPGVLSSHGGRDFATLLAILSGRAVECPADGWKNSGVIPGIESAYGLAWRVLDAQYFGVPQRRRRVFVVGRLGNWRRAAAVLLERSSLCGNPAPRRKAWQGAAARALTSTDGGIDREDRHTLICMSSGQANAEIAIDHATTLNCLHEAPVIAFNEVAANAVRRLTPRECERLQGFPDDYTAIVRSGGKIAADFPRYRALGNTMAVPCMRWIGRRIEMVMDIPT